MDLKVNNKNLHFQGQYSNETVLAFFRRHWSLVLPHLLITFLFIFLLVVALIILPRADIQENFRSYFQILMVALILLISLFLHSAFIMGLKHFLNIVIITDLRIVEVKKSLFMKDSQDSLLLGDILDVQRNQNGFWKNVLEYGELLIMLQSGERILSYVPNPSYHFRLINMAKQNYTKVSEKHKSPANPKNIL